MFLACFLKTFLKRIFWVGNCIFACVLTLFRFCWFVVWQFVYRTVSGNTVGCSLAVMCCAFLDMCKLVELQEHLLLMLDVCKHVVLQEHLLLMLLVL